MSPWKVIFATMVIFACGVVTGVLVIRTQGLPEAPPSIASVPSPGAPGPVPVWNYITRLNSKLDLTPEQLHKIEKIMQDSQATNAAIRKTIAPLLKAEVERDHKAINDLLTAEQQPKYAELLKEQSTEGRRGRGGDGGRRPNHNSTNGLRGPTNLPSTNFPSTNGP